MLRATNTVVAGARVQAAAAARATQITETASLCWHQPEIVWSMREPYQNGEASDNPLLGIGHSVGESKYYPHGE
jgi:hypothetical protein